MAEKRTYEVMYIAAPETADEDVTKLNESLQQIIENGGGSI
ncbi:MAG: 30S ribosomal protein S6, partial [Acidobacteria bacterium]|nr:30S ribosomal protein S6 [Acidobacteriota bacterium]